MSDQKRKTRIEAAAKLAQKGQLAKAIDAYRALRDEDPSDMRTQHKLAEVLARNGPCVLKTALAALCVSTTTARRRSEMAFANHGRAGARFHPNGVKATPWQTQKISRIGQHVQGARRPRPEHEEVKCLKIGERAQTLTVKQPPRHQEAHGWDVQ